MESKPVEKPKEEHERKRQDRTKFIPMVIVNDSATNETPISKVEQIATRKGERHVNVVSKRQRKVPKQDVDGLEALFTSDNSKNRHSIAIGELDSLNFQALPTQSGNFSIESLK